MTREFAAYCVTFGAARGEKGFTPLALPLGKPDQEEERA